MCCILLIPVCIMFRETMRNAQQSPASKATAGVWQQRLPKELLRSPVAHLQQGIPVDGW